ncbi:MAG: VOC family protein [Mycobacterium sp.]
MTARIVVSDADVVIKFLREVFAATGAAEQDRPAILRVGDSTVMVSQAGERETFPAFLYVYVRDADSTYRRALSAGAISMEEPCETGYGDRRAMFRDSFGNFFQIAEYRP